MTRSELTAEERRVLEALHRAAAYGAAGAAHVAREAGLDEDLVRADLLALIRSDYVVAEGGGPAEETYDLTSKARNLLGQPGP